jgi:hypothetical protein
MPWDPSGIVAQPTTTGGRLVLGAEAEDRRRELSWLASRGSAHLFRDVDGTYWEHSSLRDTRGTPQLEELSAEEAASRYGPPERWTQPSPLASGMGTMLRSLLQAFRYRRGWRPVSEPEETIVEGRRMYLGGQAITRTYAMRWVSSVGGDNLHVDEDGTYWEWRNEGAASGNSQLRELTAAEARAKYGIDAED